ncbi:MAG TPA: winged helix-turn-helix transcriptional regulator, partial [Cellulomonas sp.]|nr:winged helix-turn-helix transcriptional regulator [Cellulomonas sp.]
MSIASGGKGAATRSTGSQQALRERNIQLVVSTLGVDGPQTQAMLARRTGLSTGTVSNIVRELAEQKRISTESTISAGRRAVEVALVPDGRVVVGVDIGRSHVRVMGMDTAQVPFGTRSITLGASHSPADTLLLVRRMIDEMLAEHHVDRTQVTLCGVALPASLDPTTGLVAQASVLAGWSGIDLVEATTQAFDLPVMLEN